MVLPACAGELATPGEALRLLGTELPDAIVSEPYQAQFHAVGGLRPYEYSVSGGELPAGLELVGGELRGTPSATGSYEFTIEVTDANLSSTSNDYGLAVITPPPTGLDLQLPQTEVRAQTTVRVRVTDARSLVGLRTELTWDPARFTLEDGSVSLSRQQAALLQEAEPGRLRVDVAMLGASLTGEAELFSFVLVPLETPATLAVASATEFASRVTEGFRREFEETGGAAMGAPPVGVDETLEDVGPDGEPVEDGEQGGENGEANEDDEPPGDNGEGPGDGEQSDENGEAEDLP